MRLLPILLASLLMGNAASAQGRKISFRTLCLDYSGDVTEVALAGRGGEGAVTVPLMTAAVSDAFEATFEGNQATFYLKGSDPSKPVVAAKGPLTSASRQLLLFLPEPVAEGKPRYQIRAYDDDLSAFPIGSVRAINLAPVPVRFVISGAPTPQIPANKHAIFPHPKKVDDYNMYSAQVEFLSANGSWHKGYSSTWKASKKSREIVVTAVDGKFKQPVVKIYRDRPAWLDQEATTATP